MSFKNAVVQDGTNRYVLARMKDMKCDVVAFLSPELFQATEEGLWNDAYRSACYEGANGVYLMPDCHQGYVLPVGGVLVTDDVIVQAGSGYDISCGVVYMKVPGLHASDIADWDTRLRWVREVERRVATGVGSHLAEMMKVQSSRKIGDVLRYGAKAVGVHADICERHFIEVGDDFNEFMIKDAYVTAKKAEGERDAALRRAEAVKAQADGAAEARRAQADGEADALKIQAEADAAARKIAAAAYAAELTAKAEAEYMAAEKTAQARTQLAEAALKEGAAKAEAERLMVEARNAVATSLVVRDVAIELIKQAPAIVHEVMAPVGQVTHDVKVLQVNGLGGGEGAGTGSTTGTVLGTGLTLTGVLPLFREAVTGLLGNEDVKQLAGAVTGVVRNTVKETVAGVADGLKGDSAPESASN